MLDLMSPYFERHYHLYFDNFYTSPKLLLELEKHKTYACETVRSNRGQFPTEFMDNIEVGESVFIQSGNLLTLHWKDKHGVYMSTIHDNRVTEIQRKHEGKVTKPNMIIAYNKYMGEVDKCDQYLNYYSVGQKSLRWWKRTFFHFVE